MGCLQVVETLENDPATQRQSEAGQTEMCAFDEQPKIIYRLSFILYLQLSTETMVEKDLPGVILHNGYNANTRLQYATLN